MVTVHDIRVVDPPFHGHFESRSTSTTSPTHPPRDPDPISNESDDPHTLSAFGTISLLNLNFIPTSSSAVCNSNPKDLIYLRTRIRRRRNHSRKLAALNGQSTITLLNAHLSMDRGIDDFRTLVDRIRTSKQTESPLPPVSTKTISTRFNPAANEDKPTLSTPMTTKTIPPTLCVPPPTPVDPANPNPTTTLSFGANSAPLLSVPKPKNN